MSNSIGGFCLIAAAFSKPFLHTVSRRILKDLDQQKRLTKSMGDEINVQKIEFKNEMAQKAREFRVNSALDNARTALNSSLVRSDFFSARKGLHELLDDPETEGHRLAIIFLGRLYAEGREKNVKKTIEVITEFLDKKKKMNKLDEDYYDLLYNRSCYYCGLSGDDRESDADRNQFVELAKRDFIESIEKKPENVLDAEDDEDLACVRKLKGYPFVQAAKDILKNSSRNQQG